MSKDITGIKKMKVERARRESLQDKETFTEFTKRFTAENFVDQVSELHVVYKITLDILLCSYNDTWCFVSRDSS